MYTLDHIGIAVPDLGAALAIYQGKLGMKLECRETVASQGVEVAFLKLANSLLELLAPLNNQSGISKFLEKRGSGLHHIGYLVTDIDGELRRLKAQGFELIDSKPRIGARNHLIAFVHPRGTAGVLTELCQSKYDAHQPV